MAAHEHQLRCPRPFRRQGVAEGRAARRHNHHPGAWLAHRLDSATHGLGLQHHARAAAVGIVVHHRVAAGRVVAELVDVQREQFRGAGAPQDASVKGPDEHLREKRDDVDSQAHRPLAEQALELFTLALGLLPQRLRLGQAPIGLLQGGPRRA